MEVNEKEIGYGLNYLDKDLKAVGDKVVIRKFEVRKEKVVGGIIIPYSLTQGCNLSRGTVVSVGADVPKEGLKVGDVVLFDHYSTYGETFPICVTKYENVICLYDEAGFEV